MMVTVKVNNSKVMSSIENASISITSPSGKTITLYKKHLSSVSQPMVDLFWKCCKDPMTRFIGEVELTVEEMKLALEFSNISYFK